MTSPVSPSLQSMQHDKTYYIHSADLVFLVENLFFRVHRYFFERESVYFQTLFATPHDENEPAPGSSDSSAIMLDTTASQFSRFVWVFYNPKFSLYDEATLEDWKSILELSHRWLFPEIKQLAIRQLQKQPLSPVQRIELYHRNFVDRTFLISDYLSLCQRPSPLSLREGLDLGLETTLMIARTREEIRTPRSPEGVMTPLTPTLQGPELIDLIGKLFVTSENNNDKNDGGEDDDIGQPATTTILINGVPEPKKTPTVTNGHSNSISGGSPLKPQVTKQTEQANKQNQARGKQRNQAKKKVNPNENLALGATGPKPTTTTTSQTAETKKGAATENEERTQNKEAEQIQTPVAGQQGVGAGAGGSANGAQNNQENEKDSSKAKGDEKPGATVVGTEAEKKTEGAVDAQGAGAGGTGEPLGSNGDTGQTNGDVDKDKTTGTQGSPTTAKPTGPGTPVNGVSTNNDESLVAS